MAENVEELSRKPANELVLEIERMDFKNDRDTLTQLYDLEQRREKERAGSGRTTVYNALRRKGLSLTKDEQEKIEEDQTGLKAEERTYIEQALKSGMAMGEVGLVVMFARQNNVPALVFQKQWMDLKMGIAKTHRDLYKLIR